MSHLRYDSAFTEVTIALNILRWAAQVPGDVGVELGGASVAQRYAHTVRGRKDWCKDNLLVRSMYSIYMAHYNNMCPS